MTLRLSRHQRLELCRSADGHLLLLCWTLAPVRWPVGRVRAGWVTRCVGEWPRERVVTTKEQPPDVGMPIPLDRCPICDALNVPPARCCWGCGADRAVQDMAMISSSPMSSR